MPEVPQHTVDVDGRMRGLLAITASLAEASSAAQVIEATANHLVETFGSAAVIVAVLTEDGLEIARQVGFAPDGPVGIPTALKKALDSARPVIGNDDDRCAIALPMSAGGHNVGVLYVVLSPTSAPDVEFLMSITNVCGQALARAQAVDTANKALAQLEAQSEARRLAAIQTVDQNRILELIANGKPIEQILTSIATLIEAQVPGACAVVSILDPAKSELRMAAGPAIPTDFAQMLTAGVRIGEGNGSCAAAAYRREQIISPNIATDQRWLNTAAFPLKSGLRACASTPILGNNEQVLGTFALFYRHPLAGGSLVGAQADLVEVAVHLARIAIERDRVDSGRRAFLAESLAMVTEGHLLLCRSADDFPAPKPGVDEMLPITRATMSDFRHRARAAGLDCGFSQARCDDLVTGVTEAAANTLMHAGGTGRSWIHADRDNGRVYVWIIDSGTGIDDDALHHATLERGWTTAGTLGHGFWIMLRMIDCTFLLTTPTGTTVILEQKKTPSSPDWMAK